MRNIFLGFFLLFVFGVIYSIFNLGVFKEVTISEGTYPELKLVYRDHVGPFHEIGEAIEKVEKWAKENNINCQVTFGQYLDNPSIVEHERLRSRGGCVVSELPENLPADTHTLVVHESTYYIAKFHGSPWIGPYKVYSKVAKRAAQDGVEIKEAVIELYELVDSNKMLSTYLFPKPPPQP